MHSIPLSKVKYSCCMYCSVHFKVALACFQYILQKQNLKCFQYLYSTTVMWQFRFLKKLGITALTRKGKY